MKVKVKSHKGEREVVALHYLSHFVMRGENGEAVYLTSDEASVPPPNTAFVHPSDMFDDLINSTYTTQVVYKGDKVTLQF